MKGKVSCARARVGGGCPELSCSFFHFQRCLEGLTQPIVLGPFDIRVRIIRCESAEVSCD